MKIPVFKSLVLCLCLSSCVSIKNTIKNIDDNAPTLVLLADNTFEINKSSKDKRYGFNKDYPINIFFVSTLDENINQPRFLDALAGPNGEKISYKKIENCCPFPSKKSNSGAGLLDVYELTWKGQKKPIRLYLNIYEKGILMIPFGLTKANRQ